MKKLLSLLTIAATTAAIAAVTGDSTFGVLKVTIPANQQNTVIAAPWVEAGESAGEKKVLVADLVKTTNIPEGTMLYVFSGKDYTAAFKLVDSAWDGFEMVGTITARAGDPATTAIARGQAVALCFPAAQEAATDIYLYGQYKTGGATATLTAGSSETPTYNLLAPVNVGDDIVLNGDWVTAQKGLTPATGDMVYVPGTGYAPYVSGEGYKGFGSVKSKFDSTQAKFVITFTPFKIPAGTGFWYISKGGSGTISL